MKPGSKPTVEQYTSKSNRVDMNVVGVEQAWMNIQNRQEQQVNANPMQWTPPSPGEIKVMQAHHKNFECCRGSATFEAGKILAKE
jgi:hypothetical protein